MTMSPGLVGSNAVIRECAAGRLVLKTLTRKGPVYHYDHNLQTIPRDVAERLIERSILLPREESGQSFELSSEWVRP